MELLVRCSFLVHLVLLFPSQRPVVAVCRFHPVGIVEQVDLVAILVGEVGSHPDILLPFPLAMTGVDAERPVWVGTTVYSFSLRTQGATSTASRSLWLTL